MLVKEINGLRIAAEIISIISGSNLKLEARKKKEDVVDEQPQETIEPKETTIQVTNRKVKFKNRTPIRHVRVVGNLEVLESKKAFALNIAPKNKDDIENLKFIVDEFGDNIDIVIDILNDKLIRVRLYKHNPDFDKLVVNKQNTKQKEAKDNKEETKEELFSILEEIMFENETQLVLSESDIDIKELAHEFELKLVEDPKIKAELDKFKDTDQDILILIGLLSYLNLIGQKMNATTLKEIIDNGKLTDINVESLILNLNGDIRTENVKDNLIHIINLLGAKFKQLIINAIKIAKLGKEKIKEFIKRFYAEILLLFVFIGLVLGGIFYSKIMATL